MPLGGGLAESDNVTPTARTRALAAAHGGPPSELSAPVLSADAAEASQRVLQLLASRMDMEMCLLSLRQGDTYVILEAVDPVLGLRPGPLGPWSETLCAVMAEGRGPRVAPDIRDVPAYQAMVDKQGLPIRSYAGSALRAADGTLLGSICAFSVRPRGPELHEQYSLLSTFGLVLAQVLDRELSAQQARTAETAAIEQARTDTLTGVLNRRGWQDVLHELDRWCRREEQRAAVFVVDVDELKATNDREGHDAGDALLQRAASALTDAAVLCALRRDRPGSSAGPTPYAVARTGGDEFAVVLTRFDAVDCPAVADELRRALTDAGVTASLGFAVRHPVRGLALACRDADQLMLAEKRRRQSARVPSPRSGTAPMAALGEPVPASEPTSQTVGRLLSRVRELFGLESAFVSRFDDGFQTFTHINTSVPLPISVGDTRPMSSSLCRRVLDGRLPAVITDATQHRDSAEIDVVKAGYVRAYLSVPVTLPGGQLYGTLCCLSSVARPDITDQAAAALAFAAEQVGELLGRDSTQAAYGDAAARRLEALLAKGGLHVALQPVIDLQTGRTVGNEALARFADGRTPDVWFAEAALAGQSERLELAAFDAALAVVVPAGTFLAVNVSPTVLMSPALAQRLDALVGAPG